VREPAQQYLHYTACTPVGLHSRWASDLLGCV
jgi:hypothetical protein